jgi:hypothetical protein
MRSRLTTSTGASKFRFPGCRPGNGCRRKFDDDFQRADAVGLPGSPPTATVTAAGIGLGFGVAIDDGAADRPRARERSTS